MPAIAKAMPRHMSGRDCPRCGKFWLTGTAVAILPHLIGNDGIKRSMLSHRLRKRIDATQEPVFLYESDLKQLVDNTPLPKPQEQADSLILWIGNSQQAAEEWAHATAWRLAAIVGAGNTPGRSDEPGFNWLFQQIKESGLFVASTDGSQIKLRLTMAGWKEFDTLSRRVAASYTAFMAMQFNDSILNKVLDGCFRPAVARAGFTLRPLNEGQGAGLIDNQMRAAIRSARFVVADLSHDNNGAYFEAGMAEGLEIPVIYTCEAKKFAEKKTHFDTNHMVTIPWSINELEKVGLELTATVRNTLPGAAKLSDD